MQKRLLFLLYFFLGLSCFWRGKAQPNLAQKKNKTNSYHYFIQKTSTPIAIDGKLEEEI
jgi:hypothetical protein